MWFCSMPEVKIIKIQSTLYDFLLMIQSSVWINLYVGIEVRGNPIFSGCECGAKTNL